MRESLDSAPRRALLLGCLVASSLVWSRTTTRAAETPREAGLRTLEAAREAGILTADEHARQRAELAGDATPPPSAGAREPAAADPLGAARAAGLISRTEWERLSGSAAAMSGKGSAATLDVRDPRGRFRLQVPSSWRVEQAVAGGGLTLSGDRVTIEVRATAAQDPDTVLRREAERLQTSWTDLEETGRDSVRTAAGPARRLRLRGRGPTGAERVLEVIACPLGREAVVLVMAAPTASPDHAARLAATWTGILASFGPDTRRRGTTYRHPVGFSFWYPEGWSVQERDDFLQLVPPEPSTSPEGPNELYFIIGDSVAGEGIRTPDHPEVAAYLDEHVRSWFPILSRSGAPGKAPMARGTGAVYEWSGRSPGGQTVRSRAYTAIIGEFGVALLAVALEEHLTRRDPALRSMFASFGFGEGRRDPALVGSWSLLTTTSIHNDSPWLESWDQATLVSDASTQLELRRDGAFRRVESSRTIAGASGVWIDSGETVRRSEGRWHAGDGALWLVWRDGTWEDYRYEIRRGPSGRRLRLTAGSSVELWREAP